MPSFQILRRYFCITYWNMPQQWHVDPFWGSKENTLCMQSNKSFYWNAILGEMLGGYKLGLIQLNALFLKNDKKYKETLKIESFDFFPKYNFFMLESWQWQTNWQINLHLQSLGIFPVRLAIKNVKGMINQNGMHLVVGVWGNNLS